MISLYKLLFPLLAIQMILSSSCIALPTWAYICGIFRRAEESIPSPIQTEESPPLPITKLMLFISQGNTHAIRDLLSSDAPPDINEQDPINGVTPLMFAVLGGNASIVELLCQYGADPLRQTKGRIQKNAFDFVLDNLLCECSTALAYIQEGRAEAGDISFWNSIAHYEKMIWLCKNQVKNIYGMQFLRWARSMPIAKRQEIGANFYRNLLPVLLGSRVIQFKPMPPLSEWQILSFDKRLELLAQKNSATAHSIANESEYYASLMHFLLFSKQSLAVALAGVTVVSYVLYQYLSPGDQTTELAQSIITLLQQQDYAEAYQVAINNYDILKAILLKQFFFIVEAVYEAEEIPSNIYLVRLLDLVELNIPI